MTPQLWLQSERDYETGRRIYEALGTNAHLKRTLSTGPTTYNREAIAYELGKLAKAGVTGAVPVMLSVPTPVVESAPIATKTLQNDPTPDETGTKLLDELKAQRPPLYDERRHLHAQLELLPTDEDRLQAALRIRALSRQIDENWRQDAHVREHGHLPQPEPGPQPIDVKNGTLADLLSHRANLRSNISKWKKKPARAEDLAAAQAECAVLTLRIDDLKGKEANRG